jgi:hypothetical protein
VCLYIVTDFQDFLIALRVSSSASSFRRPFACIPPCMRPLTQTTVKVKRIEAPVNGGRLTPDVLPFLVLLTAGTWLQGCGGGGAALGNPPGSACPLPSHHLIAPGAIAEQWSTVLVTNPVTILTRDQTPAGRLNEIEQVITQSLAVWTGVSGTTVLPGTFAPVTRTSTQNACGSDGVNSLASIRPTALSRPGFWRLRA